MSEGRIARLPTGEGREEWCCVCGDDNVLVAIETEDSGDIVVFCSKCYGRMQRELAELNLGICEIQSEAR